MTKPQTQGDSTFGFYTKTGALDLLTVVADPQKVFGANAGTPVPGTENVISQLQGKKSILLVVGANGMLQALMGGQGAGATSTTTPSSTTSSTPAATTTAQ
jgi:hypothetical protein